MEPACLLLEHPVHHSRVSGQELLKTGAAQSEAAKRPYRHDVGRGRLSQENRELTEELTSRKERYLYASDPYRSLAV